MSVVCSRPVFKTSEVLQIRSLTFAPKILFREYLSGDLVTSLSGSSHDTFALRARVEVALIDWVPNNGKLCAVGLEKEVKSV